MAWENARVIMKWDNHENSGKNPELLTKMMKVGQLQKIEKLNYSTYFNKFT